MDIIIQKSKNFIEKIYFNFNGFRICGLNLLNICGMDHGDIDNIQDPLYVCMNDVVFFYEDKFLYEDTVIYGYCESCVGNSHGKKIEFIKTNNDLIKYLENSVFI